MWNKIFQAADPGSSSEEHPQQENTLAIEASEVQEQMEQQRILIEQLKELLRENEKQCQDKTKELEELSSKFQKYKLQTKAKVSHLTNQLKVQEKPTKQEDADFEDTSSSDSSDQSKRGKIIMLKKQLEQVKRQIEKKDKESQDINKNFETVINDLRKQLLEKDGIISNLKDDKIKTLEHNEPVKSASKGDSSVQEMYAQIVYKDSKMLELNNKILEHERKIIDLQEHIKEKDEVLQSRNRAIQLMTEDMSRRGKSVVDELDDTRGQMKIMQENFASVESSWKEEKNKLSQEIEEAKEKHKLEIAERDVKIKHVEETLKKLEATRFELATRNAELQEKIVLVQENADKQCENYRKALDEESLNLKHDLKKEKAHSTELQKALEEATTQSESKILKARVKERTKTKALERELASLKKGDGQNEEIVLLQQHVAELEEEKGTLQLKLMEIEEQIYNQEKLCKEKNELQETLMIAQEKSLNVEQQISIMKLEKEKLSIRNEELEASLQQLQTSFDEKSEKTRLLETEIKKITASEENLKELNNLMNEKVQMLTHEVRNLSENLHLSKSEKVTLEMRIIELEEIREGEEKIKQDLLKEMQNLQGFINQKIEPTVEYEKQKSCLEEELQKVKELNAKDHCHIKELTDELTNVQRFQQEVQNECSIISEKCINLQKENETIANKLKEKENILFELNEKLNNSNSLFNEKEHQYQLLNANYQDMQTQWDAILSTLSLTNTEEVKKVWENQVALLEELKFSIQNKAEEIESYNDKIRNLEINFEEQEMHIKEEKEKLHLIIKQQNEEKEILVSLLTEKDAALLSLQNNNIEKNELNESLSNDMQNQCGLISKLEKDCNVANEKIDSLMKQQSVENDKNKSKISSMLEQITDLDSEVSRLQTEVNAKEQFCNTIQEELKNLKVEYEICVQAYNQKEDYYQNTCEEQNRMLGNLHEQLSVTRCELHAKEYEMDTKYKDLEKRYQNEKEDAVKSYQNTIDKLNNILYEINSEKQTLNDKYITKDKELNSIRNTVLMIQKELDDSKEKLSAIAMPINEKSDINEIYLMQKQQATIEGDELNNVEFSLDNIKIRIKKLNAENLDLKNLLLQKEEYISVLNGQLENKTREFEKIQEAVTDASAVNSSFSKQIEMLQVELQEKQTIADSIEKNLETSHLENENLKSENIEINNVVTKQKEIIKNLSESEELLKQELEKSHEAVTSCKQNINVLSEKMLKLENDLEAAKDFELSFRKQSEVELHSLSQKVKDFEDENNLLRTEMKTLQDKHFAEINNLTSEIQNFQEELVNSKTETEDYKNKCHDINSEYEKLNSTITSLQSNEHALQDKLLLVEEENRKQFTVIQDMTEKSQDLSSQLEQYILHTNALQGELETLKEELQSSREEMKGELQNAVSQNRVFEDSSRNLHDQLDTILDEKNQIMEENCSLKALLDELKKQTQTSENTFIERENHFYNIEKNFKEQIQEYEQIQIHMKKDFERLQLFETEYYTVVEKFQNLEKDYQNVQSKNHAMKVENENSKTYIQQIENNSADFSKQLASYKEETDELRNSVQRLTLEKQEMQNNIKIIEEKYYSLDEKTKNIAQERDDIKQNAQSLLKKNSDIERDNVLKVKEMNTLLKSKEDILKQMNADVFSFQNKISVLENSVQSLQIEKQEFLAQIQSENQVTCNLKVHNNELAKEKDKLEIHCQELETKLFQSADHISLLQSNSSEHVQQLSTELENSHVQIQVLQSRVTEHEIKLKTIQEQFEKLKEKNTHLENEISHLCETQDKLNLDLDKTKNILEQKLNEIEIKTGEINNKEIELLSCNDKIFELESIIIKVKEENKVINSEKQSTEHKIQSCEEKINELLLFINQKDDIINQMKEDQIEVDKNTSNLCLKFETSEATVYNLREEMAKEKIIFLEQQQALENSHNTSNALQIEVEHLRTDLLTCDQERIALQQHLRNVMCQMKILEEEKKMVEIKFSQLQDEMNNLVKTNENLMNKIEKKESLLLSVKAENEQLLLWNKQEYEKNEAISREVESLKLEMENYITEKINLTEKLKEYEGIQKDFSDVQKCHIKTIEVLENINKIISCESVTEENYEIQLEVDHVGDSFPENIMSRDNFQKLLELLQHQVCCIIKNKKQKEVELQEVLVKMECFKTEKDKMEQSFKNISLEHTNLLEETSNLKTLLKSTEEKYCKEKDELVKKLDDLESNKRFSTVIVSDSMVKQESEQLQKQSVKEFPVLESKDNIKRENENLKHQLNVNKIKSEKMLTKLKIFKDKIEELQNEVKKLAVENEKLNLSVEENLGLQQKLSKLEDIYKKQDYEFNILDKNRQFEINKLNSIIAELKERNLVTDGDSNKLRLELREYKKLWEQNNVTVELQREDIEKLRMRLKESVQQLEVLKLNIAELQNNHSQLETERGFLQKEVQNLREHTEMLISDNDTFQDLTEKLKRSKILLEQDLQKQKENYTKQVNDLENSYKLELSKKHEELSTHENETVTSSLEIEYQNLKDSYDMLENSHLALQKICQDAIKDKKDVEDKNSSLNSQILKLLEELEQLKKCNGKYTQRTDTAYDTQEIAYIKNEAQQQQQFQNKNSNQPFPEGFEINKKKQNDQTMTISESHSTEDNFNIRETISAKKELEAQVESLTQDLQNEIEKNRAFVEEYAEKEKQWKEENFRNETYFKENILKLQGQVETITQYNQLNNEYTASGNDLYGNRLRYESSIHLEEEFQQAMCSLHQQGLRCEELNMEVSKLLEERDNLRLKLAQCTQLLQQKELEIRGLYKATSTPKEFGLYSEELTSVQIEIPDQHPEHGPESSMHPRYVQSSDLQTELTVLLERLKQSESTCQELQSVNETLDRALVGEQEQRKLLEEELIYAKEHIVQETMAPSEEYRLLLEDLEEPEMVIETNFSITRKVKTHAYKLRRWLRGRRNYCYRTLRSKNRLQLIYFVYLFAIHLWLLMCISGL